MELYAVSKNKTRGSDHELFIAKLRPKLKEVGKTPREGNGNKHSLPTTQEKTLYMDITRWSTPKSD